jgi:hypothetical protein
VENYFPWQEIQKFPIMEVLRSQTPVLCGGKAHSLKGTRGSNSLASQGQWSPMLAHSHTLHEVTFNFWAIDSTSVRNKFLVVTEMGNLSGISS